MSSMSYTAYFPAEVEKKEINDLSEDEIEAILDDKYGRNAHVNRNSRIADNVNDDNNSDESDDSDDDDDDDGDDGLSGVNDNPVGVSDDVPEELLNRFYLILSQLPSDESEEFWKAWSEHPEIVEAESDAAKFLRSDNYDPQLAARRLCLYWKKRVQIFGEDNAYEEITLENKAMEDVLPYLKDLQNLCRTLPDDERGRAVFALDRTNISFKDYPDEMIFVKILWFILHKALNRPSLQTKGLVVIGINTTCRWDFPSYKLIKLVIESLHQYLPIKICCVHQCVSSLVASLLMPVGKLFWSRHARLRTQVHNSAKQGTMLNDMEGFALNRRNLPKSIGGTYDAPPTWISELERLLEKKKKRWR